MTATAPASGDGSVANQISDGVFFHAVIQGRDIQVVLPAQAPPALTGLPAASPVFTGRDDMLAALREALRPDRAGEVQLVSAVAGMAGVGKTELVLHAAHGALARGWFPGGVLFVDMFGYDPGRRVSAGDALGGWLSAIGIPGEHIPAGEQDRSRLWRSVLDAYAASGRRLLLIIDNAAAEDQVRPLLPAGGGLPVLVTSRHTLDLDARLHDLDVLEQAPAVAVLCQVIAARRGEQDPRLHDTARPALAELAGVCVGLPLALRIVAALLADRVHLEPRVLAGRLRDEQYRLDGLTRQQAAVRTAFDLSYQHLDEAQARLFRLLPVNPGPDIATASAARLAGLDESRTAALLTDLHRAHLVAEPVAERWGMHDLLRLYATEQQSREESEVGEARERLYRYYQETAQAANTHFTPAASADTRVFGDRADALAWLDAEHANLIATATTAVHHQLAEVSTRLAFTLAEYLQLRRYFTDWITLAAQARDILRQTGDRHGEGMAWGNLGLALTGVRRFEEAIDAHTHDLAICQEIGDRHGEGQAWSNLGLALQQVGRHEEAIDAHTRARDNILQIGDRHREGHTWNNLGAALGEVGRFEEAIDAHTRACDIFQQTGNLHGEGMARGNLGVDLGEVGRFEEAIDAHTRARDLFQQTGDRHGEARAWGHLGAALVRVGRFEEAIDVYTRACDIFGETGDQHREAGAWGDLGAALAGVGRFEEAIDAQARARELFQQADDRHGEGMAWGNLGLALQRVGQIEKARSSLEQAIEALAATGDASSANFVRAALDALPPADTLGPAAQGDRRC